MIESMWIPVDDVPRSGSKFIVTDGESLAIGRYVRKIIDPRRIVDPANESAQWVIIEPIEGTMSRRPTHYMNSRKLKDVLSIPENPQRN